MNPSLISRAARLRFGRVVLLLTLLLTTPGHTAPTITQTIDVVPGADTFFPRAIGIDESRDRLYIAGSSPNNDAGTSFFPARVAICEGNGRKVITGVELGAQFYVDAGLTLDTVAVDGGRNRAYVFGFKHTGPLGDPAENFVAVKVIDGASKTVASTIVLAGTPYPSGVLSYGRLALNKATNKLYVTTATANDARMFVVDLATPTATPVSFPIGGGNPGPPVAVNETTNRIYTSHVLPSGETQVEVIHGDDNSFGTPVVVDAGGTQFFARRFLICDEPRNKVYLVAAVPAGQPQTGAFRIVTLNGATASTPASVASTTDVPMTEGHGFFGTPMFDPVAGRLYVSSNGSISAPRTFVLDALNGFQNVGTIDDIGDHAALNATTKKIYAQPTGSFATATNLVRQYDLTTPGFANLATGATVANVIYDDASDRIWAADGSNGELYVVNAATGVVEAQVSTGGASAAGRWLSRALAFNPATRRLYTASHHMDGSNARPHVEVVDMTTRQLLTAVPLFGPEVVNAAGPNTLAADAATNRIYADRAGANVLVLDGATHVTSELPATAFGTLFVEPAANRLWTTNDGLAGLLSEHNLATGAQIRDSGDVFTRPYGISIHRRSGRALVANGYVNSATFVNLSDLSVENNVQFIGTNGGFNRVHVVATNPTNNEAYALLEYDDAGMAQLEVLDMTTATGTSELPLGAGVFPLGLAVNAADRELYIAGGDGGSVVVVGGLAEPAGGGGGGAIDVTVTPTTGAVEIASIEAAADVNRSLAADFFTVHDAAGPVRVWFNVNGTSVAPAAPSGGRLLPVIMNTNASATKVAAAINLALANDGNFTTKVAGKVVTITADTEGPRTDIDAGTSGFGVWTLAHGRPGNTTPIFPGDAITYTVAVKNNGTQPLERVLVTSPVPAHTTVDAASLKRSSGRLVRGMAQWTIPSIAAGATATRAFTVKAKDLAGLPGTAIANATTTALARGGSTVTAPPVATPVANPLAATALSLQATTLPGGFVEYRATVRNLGNVPARAVAISLPVPARCGLVLSSEPAFLDASGDAMTRAVGSILANGKLRLAGAPAVTPYVHPQNGNRINPGYPADRRSVSWFLGDMAPGEEQVLKMVVRLRFDDTDPAALALPAIQAARFLAGTKITAPSTFASGLPSLTVNAPADNAPQPHLALYVRGEGAGQDEDPRTGSYRPVVTTLSKPVPGASPARKTNQLRFTATYTNSGDVVAESLRVLLLIPPGTVLDRNSVATGDESGLTPVPAKKVRVTTVATGVDVPEIDDELADGGFLVLDVPFLEAGFPAAGAGKTVHYTVTLKPKRGVPGLGDELATFGVIQSDMFHGVPYFNAAALSTPLVTTALVVPPVVFQPEHADAVLAADTADNRLLTAQAFYRNTAGTNAVGVVAVVTIPEGATYEPGSAALLNASGQSVTGSGGSIEAGRVLLPLGNYQAGQRTGTLLPGQTLRVKIAFRTLNASVPTSATPDSRASSVTPAFFLHHAADPLPSSLRVAARSRRFTATSGTLSGTQREVTAYVRKADDPVWFAHVDGPATAAPDSQITFLLAFGNTSNTDVSGTFVFPIPPNTTYVSHTSIVQTGSAGVVNFFQPADSIYPNGHLQGAGGGAHYAGATSVTVQINGAPSASELVTSGVFMGAQRGGYIFPEAIRIPLVGALTSADDTRAAAVRSAVGGGAATAAGRVHTLLAEHVEFAKDVRRIKAGARISATAGAGFLHLKNGVKIITVGGGNIVAAGGGNVVANDGAGVVANDGAGIIAVGGGNLIGISGVVADLGQANLYNVIATAIRQQSGSLLPGASIVAGGGGNIVAGGGLNLIGHDGATLVGQDAAGLRAIVDNSSLTGAAVTFGGQPVLVNAQFEFVPALKEALARMPAGLTFGLVEQAGRSVVTFGDNSISKGSDGHRIFAADDLIGDGAGTIIGSDAASIVAAGGGNVVAGSGGNLIGDGAGTINP